MTRGRREYHLGIVVGTAGESIAFLANAGIDAAHRHIVQTQMLRSPRLRQEHAYQMAIVLLHKMKTVNASVPTAMILVVAESLQNCEA